MSFTEEDVRANLEFFRAKLRAERQKVDVARWVRGELPADFVLVDVRQRDAFAQGHIPGAVNVPLDELPALMAHLPKSKELVTYCWSGL